MNFSPALRKEIPPRRSRRAKFNMFIARNLSSRNVNRLHRMRFLCRCSLLCTFAFTLSLSIFLYLWLTTDVPPGVLDGRNLAIPYRSRAEEYATQALYTAPLPVGTSDVQLDQKADPALVAKVQRRSARQRALEDELNEYLQSEGLGRDRPVRVRFHVLSNYVDWKLCTAVGAAALGGFSIPITNFNKTYSHVTRFSSYLDFVNREGLLDEDIVVTIDSDVFWTGADFMPLLKKFARFSPAMEVDLDVAAVRAWEDYGDKKAPLYMERLQKQEGTRPTRRPSMQLPPVLYNADDLCWWGQHSKGFVRCPIAFAAMEHMIEVARNGKSSYTRATLGAYTHQCATSVQHEVEGAVPGDQRWMVDDMFNVPNASSPYTKKPQVSPSDPLFYRLSTVNRASPTSLLNGGMHMSRVWALRYLARTLAFYVAQETPVPEAEDHHNDQWWCDQALLGQIYIRARMFEIEHQLLDGPLPSKRSPPVVPDPRFGPPGLLGIDRRSEMVVLAPTMERNPTLFHDGGYLERQFPNSVGFWLRNRTLFLLGENWPKAERMGDLQMTRGGALVTPPLLWRSATPEDRMRGYENEQEADADTVHVPFIHYAAPSKQSRFSSHRNHYAWLVAARHDKRARETVSSVLSNEVVELWMDSQRVYVEYSRMCEDPTLLSPKRV